MAKRAAPEVNAGSMADIAFLLLIFFLVTTTIEKDKGILRSLPPIEDSTEPPVIKKKNRFDILVSRQDRLLVEEEEMDIKDLKEAAIAFLDNGGGVNAEGEKCDYCRGKRDEESSDHPDKAIITLKHDRETSYGTYIQVQNELVAAYNELREREAQRLFNRSFASMLEEKDKNQFSKDEKLNDNIQRIKDLYPLKLSESEPDKIN